MNIEKTQIDELSFELTLNISNEDYTPVKKKKLNDYRKRAEFKGFRKGNVPMSLIERVYGEQALGDAVNDLISEQLGSYIKDNNLNLIGEPIASENQPEIDWKDGNDFVFKFDLATAPVIDFTVSADDKVVNYTIKSTAAAKDEMKKAMLMQYGDLQEVESPSAESYIYVDLENEEKRVENAYISMRDVNEAMKPALLGVKAGDKLEINVTELLDREGDRATLLKVKKEELASINPVFNATVINIKSFVAAEANQETFDKIFGEGNVKDEKEFDEKVAERLAENYRQETDFRLGKDIKAYFTEKAAVKLPESFLRRWLYAINKGKFTMEDIDKEFDAFLVDYRWQMINEYLMKKFELKVDEKDLVEAAHGYVAYQYAMYGMSNVPEQFIHEAAQKMLDDQQQVQRLYEQVAEQKVINAVKEVITLDKKSISVEKFRELQ
ncbi:MAG: trigger factor [Bacteroidales bacterium]|nr:trigger factor [Bacteroidales bacterium]